MPARWNLGSVYGERCRPFWDREPAASQSCRRGSGARRRSPTSARNVSVLSSADRTHCWLMALRRRRLRRRHHPPHRHRPPHRRQPLPAQPKPGGAPRSTRRPGCGRCAGGTSATSSPTEQRAHPDKCKREVISASCPREREPPESPSIPVRAPGGWVIAGPTPPTRGQRDG